MSKAFRRIREKIGKSKTNEGPTWDESTSSGSAASLRSLSECEASSSDMKAEELDVAGAQEAVPLQTLEEVLGEEVREMQSEQNERVDRQVSPKVAKACELALECIFCPILGPDELSRAWLADNCFLLRSLFRIPGVQHSMLVSLAGHKAEFIVADLYARQRMLDRHPHYNEETFDTRDAFLCWRKREHDILTERIASLEKEQPYAGRVTIRVVEARDLAVMDMTGASDPYAIIDVESGHHKWKTTIKLRSLNPVWNEEFALDVPAPDGTLRVSLYDWDRMSKDEAMGEVRVPLAQFKDQQVHDVWLPLEQHQQAKKPNPKIRGEIHLILQYTYRQFNKSSESESSLGVHVDCHALYDILHLALMTDGMSIKKDGEPALLAEEQAALNLVPLSRPRKWLLDEFASRFGGMTEEGRLLHHFWRLVTHFRVDTRLILDLRELLPIVMDVVTAENARITVAERKKYTEAHENLSTIVETALQKYKDYFPHNKPDNALKAVIDIYQLLTRADSKAFHEMILFQLAVGYPRRSYKDILDRKATPDTLNPYRLAEAARLCITEVEDDRTNFSAAFPGLANHTYKVYHDLLWADVSALCNLRPLPEPDHGVVALYKGLRRFESMLAGGVVQCDGLEPMVVEVKFSRFIKNWIDSVAGQATEWATRAIDTDKWGRCHDGAEMSSSVVDVFTSISQYGKIFSDDFQIQSLALLRTFSVAIAASVLAYIRAVEKMIMEESSQLEKGFNCVTANNLLDLFQALSSTDSLHTMSKLCIMANDIECARVRFEGLVEDLEWKNHGGKGLLECAQLKPCVVEMERTVTDVVEMLATKTNPRIRAHLYIAILNDPQVKLGTEDELFTCLDTHLEATHDTLIDRLFELFNRRLFEEVVSLLEEITLRGIVLSDGVYKPLTPQQGRLVDELVLKKLPGFFFAEGAGIQMDVIQRRIATLQQVIALYSLSTKELIGRYWTPDTGAEDSANLNRSHILVVLSGHTKDAEAAAFVHSKGATVDMELGKLFGLPPDEVLIEKFSCQNTQLNSGFLYVFSSYVCFATFIFAQGPSRCISLPIAEIQKVKKSTFAYVFGSITITMNNAQENIFLNFTKRGAALARISEQAGKLGKDIRDKEDVRRSNEEEEGGSRVQTLLRKATGELVDALPPNAALKADRRRDERFQRLFDLPDTAILYDDYSCCLGPVLSGRLYLSQNFVCFDSPFKKVVIQVGDIISISPAKHVFIPNAINVVTSKEKYFFCNFFKRDDCLELLNGVWKGQANSEAFARYFRQATVYDELDRKVREKFHLDENEAYFTKFYCTKGKLLRKPAYLYITTSHLCLDPLGGSKLVLPFVDIGNIAKKKAPFDNALKIYMKDGQGHMITDFLNRDEAYDAILRMAAKQGISWEDKPVFAGKGTNVQHVLRARGSSAPSSCSGEVVEEVPVKATTKAITLTREDVAFQQRFGLSKDVVLVRSYRGSLWKGMVPVGGTIYVSATHVCFYAKPFVGIGPETNVVIPLSDVEKVSKGRVLGLPSDFALQLVNGKEVWFSCLFLRDELFELVYNLWWEAENAHDIAADVREEMERPDRQYLCTNFSLPDDERLFSWFSCMNSWKMHGFMYVTNMHVLFDTTIFGGGRNRVLIPLVDIDKLETATLAGFINSLRIWRISEEKPVVLCAFPHIDRATRDIMEQALAMGHEIQLI